MTSRDLRKLADGERHHFRCPKCGCGEFGSSNMAIRDYKSPLFVFVKMAVADLRSDR